ncbi:RNA polymerase sigma factor [Geodermatophilus sabuli]|uniref:RNA polymerase sigma factor, sigma-70 family n=1 Tax=Geodermatophilus sabuli TaxID=1564158 RepID=A0A285EEZ2_9ACTN|nr:sigma-70 family RNA polymerase sigma factor [Geodermatophilus sabuli]MBB3086213.1 RNA polymerase sigma factor (sigma-70 family) [Geodermatophilus sabuli]SNX97570.1 RNA polymerase sigma factor, sigma-70 family [Geodermatophilus sabuli]
MAASLRQPTRPVPVHGGEATVTVFHPRRWAHEITAQLVRRAADGDEAAWTAVVEEYGSLVWSVTRSFRLSDAQAADAVQTTWLRLLEEIDAIREPERLAGWLRTTARRTCLETIRRTGRELPSDPHAHESGAAPEPAADRPDGDPEEQLLRQERVTQVRSALQQLPERSQQLLELLVASPPMSYEEIGTRLGMPVGSIGPTRARLLTRLRTTLTAAGVADAA